MGFMDKVKDSVTNLDTKIGDGIDKTKIDSQIGDEKRAIMKATSDIGEAVVKALKDGKTANDADISALYQKIVDSEKKIEELNAQRDAIGAKPEESS